MPVHSQPVAFFIPEILYWAVPIDAKYKNIKIEKKMTAAWKIHGKIGNKTVVKFDETALKLFINYIN